MGFGMVAQWNEEVWSPWPQRFINSASRPMTAPFYHLQGEEALNLHVSTPSRHDDNRRLVERARHGDHGAFRQLFELYAPQVYRIIYRMVGSPDDAADLTQDVFVRVYERLHTLKDGQAFHAWLMKMAVNMVRDRLRQKRLGTLSLDAAPPGTDEGTEWQLPDRAPDQVTQVLDAEQTAQIQNALLHLSPDHRAVVVLYHLEGLPIEEISTILRVPHGTIKSRLARARAELKRRLETYLTPSL